MGLEGLVLGAEGLVAGFVVGLVAGADGLVAGLVAGLLGLTPGLLGRVLGLVCEGRRAPVDGRVLDRGLE